MIRLFRSPEEFSTRCGLIILLFGIFGITGWLVNSPAISSLQQETIQIAPESPILFTLLGIALALPAITRHPAAGSYCQGVALLTFLIGAGNLIVPWFTGGTTLVTLFLSVVIPWMPAGDLSPISACCFMLIGLAALLVDREDNRMSGVPGVLAGSIGSVILFGYIYNAPLLYGSTLIPVSLPSAVAFILITLGYITRAGSGLWPLSVFTGDSSRAILMRYLFPVLIGLVIGMELAGEFLLNTGINPALITAIKALAAIFITFGLVYFLSDTTGRRIDRITELLAISEEKFRTLYDLAPYGCIMYGLNGEYILVNRYHEEVTGYSPDDVIGKKRDQIGLISPDQEEWLAKKIRVQGYLRNEEITLVTRDGISRTVLFSASPVMLKGERYVLSVMVDITERLRMEEDLRRSMNQITGIAETIPGVVFQFFAKDSGKMGLYYMSPRITEVFGLTGNLSTFFPLFEAGIIHEDQERFHRSIILAVESETIWNFEGGFTRPTGDTIYFRGISAPVRTGDEILFSGVLLDTTTEKLAEAELSRRRDELMAAYEQLASSEEELKSQFNEIVIAQKEIEIQEKKFRQLFESNIAGIVLHEIICDENGTPYDYGYLDANRSFEQITGTSPDDIIGKTIRGIKPDIDPEWIAPYGRVALTGETIQFETYDPDVKKYYDVRVYSPEAGQFATVFLDITKRKEAEDAIRKTNAYLEIILDNAFGPIVVWDPDNRITRINRSCELLLGIPGETLVGHPLEDLFPRDSVGELVTASAIFPDGIRWKTLEIDMKHHNGMLKTVVWNISIIAEPGTEKPLATIAQGWDVTHERALERERMMAIGKINENIAKLAILNDGIRNPISIIDCLIEDLDDTEMKKSISDQITRIDQMVTNLDVEWVSSSKILAYLHKHDFPSRKEEKR